MFLSSELSEDTDWVLLISVFLVPSPEPGMQQLLEQNCDGFPELVFPFLAGLVPGRAQPQRQGSWAPSQKCSETISTKVFSGGICYPYLPIPPLPGRSP